MHSYGSYLHSYVHKSLLIHTHAQCLTFTHRCSQYMSTECMVWQREILRNFISEIWTQMTPESNKLFLQSRGHLVPNKLYKLYNTASNMPYLGSRHLSTAFINLLKLTWLNFHRHCKPCYISRSSAQHESGSFSQQSHRKWSLTTSVLCSFESKSWKADIKLLITGQTINISTSHRNQQRNIQRQNWPVYRYPGWSLRGR